MPVKTMGWSRGRSRSTSLGLCSRAPLTINRSDIAGEPTPAPAGATGRRVESLRGRRGRTGACSDRLGEVPELSFDLPYPVPETGCVLEPEVGGGLSLIGRASCRESV